MKKLVLLLVLLFSINAYAATEFFNATSLTGGGTGALDALDVTNDDIDNGEKAVVVTSTVCYIYHYNSSSGAAESSPDVIQPDEDGGAAYAGNGRWILTGIYGATAQLANGTSINEFSIDDTLAGDSDDAVPTEQAVKAYADAITTATAAITPSEAALFQVRKSAEQTNITVGSATTVTWDTEVFDTGNDFASNTFTAPATGYYLLSANLVIYNVDNSADRFTMSIVTTARSYQTTFPVADLSSTTERVSLVLTAVADMTASDTVTVTVEQTGGSATSDIRTQSFFSGMLIMD